jgi:hypothetical protein
VHRAYRSDIKDRARVGVIQDGALLRKLTSPGSTPNLRQSSPRSCQSSLQKSTSAAFEVVAALALLGLRLCEMP